MAVTVDGYCYSWGCADGGWTGLERPVGLSVVEPGPSDDRCLRVGAIRVDTDGIAGEKLL